MVKKLTFVLLVVVLLAAGAVVSMADDDLVSFSLTDGNTGSWSDAPVMDITDEDMYIEEYSHEAVINKYRALFLDKSNQMAGIYLKEVCITKDKESSNAQDYILSATLLDDVKLGSRDSIVVMAFVETNGTFELLGAPKQIYKDLLRWYKFRLPNIGKENPNNIRVVAFLKSDYNFLELGVNLEITDHEEYVIEDESFDVKSSLKNSMDTIKLLEFILQ